MPAFWIFFWLGFVGFPLVFILSGTTQSSGFNIDRSGIWVYYGTDRKAKDATVRDVWEHRHPGKKWEDYQASLAITIGIVVTIVMYVGITVLANQVLHITAKNAWRRLLLIYGTPLLGGLSIAIIASLQTKLLDDYNYTLPKVLHILALAVMGISIIGALVLTLLLRPLPISHHWLWAPLGLILIVLFMDRILIDAVDSLFSNIRAQREHQKAVQKAEKATEGGKTLTKWAGQFYAYAYGRIEGFKTNYMMLEWSSTEYLKAVMLKSIELLQSGTLDEIVATDAFFEETEQLMLDLVHKKEMALDPSAYDARKEILQALQVFYFHCARTRKIHPDIMAVLKD